MPFIESLIETYGYTALLIGTFLEGETVLVAAGFAAHRGYLALPWVFLVAFVGSTAGDQFWFYVGRWRGRAYITSRPRWAVRAEQLQARLTRFEIPIVLGFRFMYGLRTVTPLVLGASGYNPARFALLNVAGAAAWSVLVGTAGYVFGNAFELLIGDAKRYEMWMLCVVLVVGALFWVYRAISGRKRPTADSEKHTPGSLPP